MVKLELFIDIILPTETASDRNEYQEYFQRGRGGRRVGLTALPPSCVHNLGASTYWVALPFTLNVLLTGSLWNSVLLGTPCKLYKIELDMAAYIYIYMYVYMCVCVCVCIYIYIYMVADIEGGKEAESV